MFFVFAKEQDMVYTEAMYISWDALLSEIWIMGPLNLFHKMHHLLLIMSVYCELWMDRYVRVIALTNFVGGDMF